MEPCMEVDQPEGAALVEETESIPGAEEEDRAAMDQEENTLTTQDTSEAFYKHAADLSAECEPEYNEI